MQEFLHDGGVAVAVSLDRDLYDKERGCTMLGLDFRDKQFDSFPNLKRPKGSLMSGGNFSVDHALLDEVGPFDEMFQGLSGQAFHDDEQMPIMLADLMNGADVGVVQRRGGARLAAKAFQRLRILRSIVGKKLQSDETAEQRVFRLVHHSHSAAAKEFGDPVMGDGCADHELVAVRRFVIRQRGRVSAQT